MIHGRAPLNRYIGDEQWKVVSKALKGAGGLSVEGNRMHLDAVLDLMANRMPWRDLDTRYGPWANIYHKFVRWYEDGILHGVVQALFEVGLTEGWKDTYVEISHGPSARAVKIRPLMAQIVVELRRHRDLPKKVQKKTSPKIASPVGSSARDLVKAQLKQTKAAIRARKGTASKVLSDTDWSILVERVGDIEGASKLDPRKLVNELMEVMRTNMPWNVMNPKLGSWSAIYAKFAKWAEEGTMRRIVRCLHELGMTDDWNSYLVKPVTSDNPNLKEIIGGEAALHRGRKAAAAKALKEAEKKSKARKAAKELAEKQASKAAAKAEKETAAGKAKSAKAAKARKAAAPANKAVAAVKLASKSVTKAVTKTSGQPRRMRGKAVGRVVAARATKSSMRARAGKAA